VGVYLDGEIDGWICEMECGYGYYGMIPGKEVMD
jgi:hypothetical protein